ncbi:hypothetical protein AB4Z22_26835 [Paenibacillus sp. TAF58]
MLIRLLGEKFEYSNDKESLDLLFDKLAKLTSEDTYYLSHMLLNETQIYSDFRQNVEAVLEQLDELQVFLLTPKEREEDIVITLNEYLGGALPSLQMLVNGLYQGNQEAIGTSLAEFSEGAQWVLSALQLLQTSEELSSSETFFQGTSENLQKQFIQMFNLFQDKDYIGLADLTTYELMPLLELLKDHVEGLRKVGNS